MDKKQRIEELIEILNQASERYYNNQDETMSNYEWDQLFDELAALEEETGIVLPNSPSQKTGSMEEFGEANRREEHEFPALSLAKSKDVAVLQKWAGERPIWLSWKLDGITLVLTYDNGTLTKIMTRGNGTIGTNITYLSSYIQGIPRTISEKGHLVVRGEAVISYTDFNYLNDLSENQEEQYANPRNLVAGTLGLDASRAEEVRERKVHLYAFTLVYCEQQLQSWGDRMNYLQELGFDVVDRESLHPRELPEVIERWTARVQTGEFDLPVDGLVIAFDDTEYAKTGSVTGHHATNAGMAFKWQDTEADTTLKYVEWSCAAFAISPVAVFEAVALEGTTVSRASLCNVSEMERLGIGANGITKLKVIKSNMIIPKVVWADSLGTAFEIPAKCPVCEAPTSLRLSEKTGTKTLHCTNPSCAAKQIQKFGRFVSKSGMDIDGLSVKTIMKFINRGFLSDYSDLYKLSRFREEIVQMEGFGEKSYDNMMASIEKSRKRHPANVLFALCIPLVGLDTAKRMVAACGTKGMLERLENGEGFEDIEGIGSEKSGSIMEWMEEESHKELLYKLLAELTLEELAPQTVKSGSCKDLTFVITGDVHIFANRDEFKTFVESQGGKVTGSVSRKTQYLINNDLESSSSKNKKAKELNIPIISEEMFCQLFGNGIY